MCGFRQTIFTGKFAGMLGRVSSLTILWKRLAAPESSGFQDCRSCFGSFASRDLNIMSRRIFPRWPVQFMKPRFGIWVGACTTTMERCETIAFSVGEETADLSTALLRSSGQDDKGKGSS